MDDIKQAGHGGKRGFIYVFLPIYSSGLSLHRCHPGHPNLANQPITPICCLE